MEWALDRWGGQIEKRHLPMEHYEQANGYLPHRNALLILAAAQMDPLVVIGQIAEWAPDKNYRFYRDLERMANRRGKLASFSGRIKVLAPFALMAKGRLLATYQDTFGERETQELLDNTWSCYRDEPLHCGHCGGCVQRWNGEAYYRELTGSEAMTKYENTPPLVLTPASDKVRWLRDNGWRGYRQIMERRRQNAAAARAHGAA